MAAQWIAVDWGTSNLRIWAYGADNTLLGEAKSDRGMGSLAPDEFEAALLELIDAFLPDSGTIDVMCCGMVGAKQGWAEAPYAAVPCDPPGVAQAIKPLVRDERLNVRILPGVSQMDPSDVMRGEETQIRGFLATDPKFDGVICLPGTHTKWVHISAGEIVSFRTFMTGELFALLSSQSVLRFGIDTDTWNDAAFTKAIDDAMSRPQTLASDLFSLRAAGLLKGLGTDAATARLSGLLIGLELAGARPYWLGQRIALIGSPALAARYQVALSHLGAPCEIAPSEDITLAGLKSAYSDSQTAG